MNMKKLIYLFAVMFSLVLVSTSCEKGETVTPEPEQTLEQQYPDWKNLTWVSTDGVSTTDTYPRLSIKITGDEIIVKQPIDEKYVFNGKYYKMSFNGNSVNFGNSDVYGTFTKSNGEITLITKGLSTDSHTYKLKIN